MTIPPSYRHVQPFTVLWLSELRGIEARRPAAAR
jgi:hypothetical protein